MGKKSACSAGDIGDMGSIPGSGRPRRKWQPTLIFSPEKAHGRAAWWVAVHGVAELCTTA